jgi:hypothetical protein
MKRTLFTGVIIFVGLFVLAHIAQAQTTGVPQLINYQGRVTDSEGKGVSGNKDLEFSIWSDANATTETYRIWGPKTMNVPVVDGYFNVILGPTDDASSTHQIINAFGASNRYLGIRVKPATSEIKPRQQILSTPYAVQAVQASHHSNVIPVGTVVSYWGSTAPAGWILCNGQAVPSSSEYNALRNIVGSNVPDLRGMFLRGAGKNSNSSFAYTGDSVRAVGSTQSNTVGPHIHPFDDYTYSECCPSYGFLGQADHSDGDNGPKSPYRHDTLQNSGSEETRPNNMAINFIIKY